MNPGRLLLALCLAQHLTGAAELGIFEGQTDVGNPKHAGSARFDASSRSYEVKGGGANMWFTNDALHFIWKKASGDVALAADIQFLGEGGDPHRKACLLIRQDLSPGSAYADAAFHGDGLTSLQYRENNGALTREIQANISKPRRVQIEKRGKYVSMSVAGPDGTMRPAGGAFRLELEEPFYVGLGVCAHNDERLETALFSNVALGQPPRAKTNGAVLSILETVPIGSKTGAWFGGRPT